eukprot:317395-Chlamydomonas_euryale.AAC.1
MDPGWAPCQIGTAMRQVGIAMRQVGIAMRQVGIAMRADADADAVQGRHRQLLRACRGYTPE